MNHKNSTYILIALGLFALMTIIATALESEDLDEICNSDNSVLFRYGGRWMCGSLNNTIVNYTTNNITNIFNNYSLYANNSNFVGGRSVNTLCNANGTNSSGVDCIKGVWKANSSMTDSSGVKTLTGSSLIRTLVDQRSYIDFTLGKIRLYYWDNSSGDEFATWTLGGELYVNTTGSLLYDNFFTNGFYVGTDVHAQNFFGNLIAGNYKSNASGYYIDSEFAGVEVPFLQYGENFYYNYLLFGDAFNIDVINISTTSTQYGAINLESRIINTKGNLNVSKGNVCLTNQTGCNYTGIGGEMNYTNLAMTNQSNHFIQEINFTKRVNITGALYTNNTIYITPINSQGIIYRTSSGSSNLKAIEIQNGSGTIIGGINKNGGVMIGEGAGSGGYYGGYNSPNLDIAWGGVPWTILAGAESNLATRTNNTGKIFRMGMPSFYSHEEPVIVMIGNSATSGSTPIGFGYGTSIGNMPTEYYFGAAPITNMPGNNASNIRLYLSGLGHVSFNSNRAVPLINTEYYYNWTSQLPASYTYQHWEVNPSQTAPILNVTKNLKEVLSISQTGSIISNDTVTAQTLKLNPYSGSTPCSVSTNNTISANSSGTYGCNITGGTVKLF